MKNNVENVLAHDNHELENKRKNRFGNFYSNPINLWGSVISFLLLVIIIILLFLCCGVKHTTRELSSNNDLLKKEIAADSLCCNSILKKMDILVNLDSALLKGQDSTNMLLNKLNKCCERNSRNLSQILNELKGLRDSIGSLWDILVNLQVSQAQDTSKKVVPESKEETLNKVMRLKIIKTTFVKKGNAMGTSTLVDNSSSVTFSSLKGFSKDSLDYIYSYMNENNDSSVFGFTGMVSGKNASLTLKHGGNTVYSEQKEFPLGQAGINALNSNPLSWNYNTSRFYETTFDSRRFKRGNWEFFGGLSAMIAGGFGEWYFCKHPVEVVKVYQGSNLVGEDKTYNTPMQIVSGLAAAGGTALAIKGFFDRKFSIKISQVGLSMGYSIDNK
jgi:hypothetical protein